MCQFFLVIEIEKLKIKKIEKYAFSFDIHTLLDQSTCGNNYHANILHGNYYHGDFGRKTVEYAFSY